MAVVRVGTRRAPASPARLCVGASDADDEHEKEHEEDEEEATARHVVGEEDVGVGAGWQRAEGVKGLACPYDDIEEEPYEEEVEDEEHDEKEEEPISESAEDE